MTREISPHEALRRAGYVTLPRWYFTQDQYDVIERIARGNTEEVYRIKNEAHRARGGEDFYDHNNLQR